MTLNIVASSSPHRNINNEEFLQEVFGVDWQDAWVCGFASDPDDKSVSDADSRWTGGPWRTHGHLCVPAHNNYFSISQFIGRNRWAKEFKACYACVLDDIGVKAEERDALGILGLPSWRLETSPGNTQWGYVLAPPEKNIAKVKALLGALKDRGLTDTGGQNVVRYARLPVGTNTKARYGTPYRHVWLPT